MDKGEGSKPQELQQVFEEMSNSEGRNNLQSEQLQLQAIIPTSISMLPQEVLMDIFCRLPVKSIGFCRCVSKPWLNIATSPHFSKMHLSKSSPGLLIWSFDDDLYYVEAENHFDESAPSLHQGAMALNAQLHGCDVSDVESCNGLLSFSQFMNGEPVYVCNPILGEYMTLPKSKKGKGYGTISGFGFDPITNQYKVVRMVYTDRDDDEPLLKLEVEIYTLGSTSWRSLDDAPYALLSGTYAFVNDNLHWMLSDEDSGFLGCFDIHEEKFLAPLLPPSAFVGDEQLSQHPRRGDIQLQVLEGKLCAILFRYNDKAVEIWMMMEYGVNESWVRKYVIEPPPRVRSLQTNPIIKISINGDILLLWNFTILSSYNPTQGVFRDLRISGLLGCCFRATPHVASLMSLMIMNATEDGSAMRSGDDEGGNQYGKWSKTLFPVPREQSCLVEDYSVTYYTPDQSGERGAVTWHFYDTT